MEADAGLPSSLFGPLQAEDVELTFATERRIGLVLTGMDAFGNESQRPDTPCAYVVVSGVTPGTPAAAHPALRTGHMLKSIQGTNVVGLSFNATVETLVSAERPVTIIVGRPPDAPDTNRFKRYDGTAEEQALRWVADVTGRTEEFQTKGWAMQECLKSGVALCELAEKISGKRIKAKDKPIFHRENITQFITAARGLGLQDYQTFDTEDLYREDSKNLRNVELCLRNLSKLAFTSSSYNGPCFGQPPKGAMARNSQRNLLPAAKSAPRAGNSGVDAEKPAGVVGAPNDTERQEVTRLRRELEQKERQLEAQAQEIHSLRAQVQVQQQQQQQQQRDSSGLDFDFSPDDELERLIMSEPGKTPRPGRDRPNHTGQTERVPVPESADGCPKCARLEFALAAAEAALNEVYRAYADSGNDEDGESAFESLVNDVSRQVRVDGHVAAGSRHGHRG